MRRILRKIAANKLDELGDTSTLADPAVVQVCAINRGAGLACYPEAGMKSEVAAAEAAADAEVVGCWGERRAGGLPRDKCTLAGAAVVQVCAPTTNRGSTTFGSLAAACSRPNGTSAARLASRH